MAEIKFEKAMNRLEHIVEELEKGELDIDKSLEIFEEGIKMSREIGRASCRERV